MIAGVSAFLGLSAFESRDGLRNRGTESDRPRESDGAIDVVALSARWDRLAGPADTRLDATAIQRRFADPGPSVVSKALDVFERSRGGAAFRVAVDDWISGSPALDADAELRAELRAVDSSMDPERCVDLLRQVQKQQPEIQAVATGVVLRCLFHPNSNVRQTALLTLSRVLPSDENPPQFERLLEAFLDAGTSIEKERVLGIVPMRHMLSFVPRLVSLLDATDARLAAATAKALGEFGRTPEIERFAVEALRRVVLAAGPDPSRELVRVEAALSLEKLGDESLREVIRAIAASTSNRAAAARAFEYLSRRMDESVLPLAATIVRDTSAIPTQVFTACELLGDNRQPVAREEIAHLLESSVWNTRIWALYALAAAGDRMAIDELLSAMRTGETFVARASCQRIMKLDDVEARRQANEWLEQQPEDVQLEMRGG